MEIRPLETLLILTLAAGFAGCAGVAQSPPAPASAAAAVHAENDCLKCHGPFDKLIATPANYVAPSGEKTSPHRHVPHDSKLEKDIPDCGNCHVAHRLSPLPAKGTIDLSKVTVEWCYSCHHLKNFQSCKDCHP
jgi:hypothetical protein